jgi:molybdate transport system substrate-binding protein
MLDVTMVDVTMVRLRRFAIALALTLCAFTSATADEIKVVTSGAFTAAYQELVPAFERTTGHKVVTSFGGSMGSAPDAIPNRLQRGEPFDVVILASTALDDLIAKGKAVAGSRVDLVRSIIGMAVRAGAPTPDISTVDAFKRTVLQAKSIAISTSASGAYFSSELFPRLGIADAIKARLHIIESGPVGEAVARGDAEIGFQQISELRPVKGIEIVGPLPPEIQRVTIFSAGLVVGTKASSAAKALVDFLASPAAFAAIRKSGLEPAAEQKGKR